MDKREKALTVDPPECRHLYNKTIGQCVRCLAHHHRLTQLIYLTIPTVSPHKFTIPHPHCSLSTQSTPMSGGSHTNNGTQIPFHYFVQNWIVRQQQYLHDLRSALRKDPPQDEDQLRGLVEHVVSHYQQYLEAKSTAAQQDIFIMFSPPWFSSFERTFLWISGFRPGIVFRLVTKSVGTDLSEDQIQRLNSLRGETKVTETELSKGMARFQESVVGPDFVKGIEAERHVEDGEVEQVEEGEEQQMDEALESMKENLRGLMSNADFLRATTVKEILKILSPVQSVRFLAAAAQFQLRIRAWGLEMDALRNNRI